MAHDTLERETLMYASAQHASTIFSKQRLWLVGGKRSDTNLRGNHYGHANTPSRYNLAKTVSSDSYSVLEIVEISHLGHAHATVSY